MITAYLYRADADILQAILQPDEAEVVRLVGDSGTAVLRFERSALSNAPKLDQRIVIWRDDYLLGTYLVRGTVRKLDTIDVLCEGVNRLARRRIVAFAAGSTQAEKSDPADDILRAAVRENMVTSDARDLGAYGVSVEGDLSLASTVDVAFAYQTLEHVFGRVDAAASERLVWDFAPTGDGWNLEFRVRTTYLGRDRRMSGSAPLWLGLENGVLRDYEQGEDWRENINIIYAGGQGEGSNRTVVTVSNNTDIDASVINRSEGFYNGSAYTDTTQLANVAARRLQNSRRWIDVDVMEGESLQYGRDVAAGDAITVQYGDDAYADYLVRGAKLRLQRNGNEDITLILEAL